MRARLLLVIASVTTIALGDVGLAQGTPSAADLAARIQAHYTTVRDFTADFTLSQTSGLLPQARTERGHVEVKKPSRMRWVYETSGKQEFVADGSRFYSYFPRDKYVQIRPLPRGDAGSTSLLFLAGRGNLTRDFIPSVPPDQPNGEWRLTLEPRSTPADFKTMTLEVDRTSLALRGLVIVDENGGTSRYRFLHLRENRGLPDRDFEFAIPDGVEIR